MHCLLTRPFPAQIPQEQFSSSASTYQYRRVDGPRRTDYASSLNGNTGARCPCRRVQSGDRYKPASRRLSMTASRQFEQFTHSAFNLRRRVRKVFAPPIAQIVSHYRILDKLVGAGGMGVV